MAKTSLTLWLPESGQRSADKRQKARERGPCPTGSLPSHPTLTVGPANSHHRSADLFAMAKAPRLSTCSAFHGAPRMRNALNTLFDLPPVGNFAPP
ncbi:hypothetical protein KCP69_06680 [Salmonella enterica subsp. enterica]|nr:hypothetical protein KCP69_06680 [Salmonella enterica subsp. enterica]